jgi:hypothetical protein
LLGRVCSKEISGKPYRKQLINCTIESWIVFFFSERMKKMNKRLSAKDQKALLNALEKAKEMQQSMEAKAEGKRWLEVEVPLALADILAKLTKNELTEIRSNLEIRGVSTLNKQQLAEVLEQQIPASLPDLLHKFDEKRYQIMKQIAGRGGYIYALIESEQLAYFHSRGLIFSGKHKGKNALVIPQEVVESFQNINHSAYRETIRRNTEWIKLTHGLLFYYGTLNLHESVNLIKQLTGMDVEIGDYLSVLEDSIWFYGKIQSDPEAFSNILITDWKQVQQEHEMRSELPFYPFTKSQFLQAGEPEFVDRNPSHQAFVDFICKHYTISREEADFIVEDCADAIRNGRSPGNLLQLLQQSLEINNLELTNAFMNHTITLHNNTRQWALKGYTPNELSVTIQQSGKKAEVIDFATRQNVGRNDPCPCGSGKKHKKCCGA